MGRLEEAVLKAVEEYDKYRSPEARARLIEIWENRLTVDFEGTFCQTCGVYDYLEDFIYELQRFVDVSIKILNLRSINRGRLELSMGLKERIGIEKFLRKGLPNIRKL